MWLLQSEMEIKFERKKKMKKVFSCIIFCFMMFMATATVSAATVNGKAVSTITPRKLVTGDEKISTFPQYTISYSKVNSDQVYIEYGLERYGVVIPINITEEGYLYLDLVKKELTESGNLDIELYYDKNCTQYVSMNELSQNSNSDTRNIYINKAGTYYLAFLTNPNMYSLNTNKITFRPYFYSSAGRTLKNGKWMSLVCNKEWSDGTYYKLVTPQDGHIKVEAYSSQRLISQQVEIEICNNRKVPIYGSNGGIRNGTTAGYYLKKGTYYIYIAGHYIDPMKIKYTFYKLGDSAYTFTNGKKVTIDTHDSPAYIKYKATNNGYITISDTSSALGMYATLCNSSKKEISFSNMVFGQIKAKAIFGVKKGTTYYVKFENEGGSAKVKLSAKAVKEKSGSSRKKAVSLKAGKTVGGVLEAGSKTNDWYKIKLTKKKKIKVTVDDKNMNGATEVNVYDSKGKKVYANIDKLKKGTYYIKVSRNSSKASGSYKLKWK